MKPALRLDVLLGISIAERLPLKQGLKHGMTMYAYTGENIAERLPLKQGLKHPSPIQIGAHDPDCRTASIKTRIETV